MTVASAPGKIVLAGEYAGEYEASLVAKFEAMLPEIPPWKRE